jgi:hypothetical protein
MRTLFFSCYFLLLTACALPGLEQPQGPRDRLAYATSDWKAANRSLVDLCGREVIPMKDCEDAEAVSERVYEALGLAEAALNAGDVSTAEGKMAIAREAIVGLQKLVRRYEVPTK